MERTAVGSWLRTTQAWCSQVCEKETLDHGIAFYDERYASMPCFCQFREVTIADPSETQRVLDETEAWFTSQGLRCLRWAPAEGQSDDVLAEVLRDRGFERRDWTAMALARRVELAPVEGVRVLPARAMRAAFRESLGAGLLADAFLERLDDPQLDMSVAVTKDGPVGTGGFFQVGDIGRVVAPRVKPGEAAVAVERTLLAAALGLARRLELRTVLIQVPSHDAAMADRYAALGFTAAGGFVEFEPA